MGQTLSLELSGLALGWREGLLSLIALIALYMLLEVVRARRLRRQKKNVALPEEPELTAREANQATTPEDAPTPPPMAWSEAPLHLAQEAFMSGVENELAQMREELDALRGELAALRGELRQELGQVRASQTVSPLYSDAMQMAVNGYGAEIIAERCGISRAEAELVVSLVNNREH